MTDLAQRAQVLIEALPYIRKYRGHTVVVKYGGAAMIDDELKQSAMQDVVLLYYVGMKPIVVHGGGNEISEMMKATGKEPMFVDGLRVTDEETMRITEMVLAGHVQSEIVQMINQQGGNAVGLSGKDAQLMRARKRINSNGKDLGFVGDVEEVNPAILATLVKDGFIPVISPIAYGENGHTYNLNADHAAGRIAASLGAVKLILLTDIKGVLLKIDDPSSCVPELTVKEAREMIISGAAGKGMIPKLQSCIDALERGVERAHIIDGRIANAILMEIFTDSGIGTMVVNDPG